MNFTLYKEAFTGRAQPTQRCTYCLSEHHSSADCPDAPDVGDMLPFSLRSAPKIFTALAVALNGVSTECIFHYYLDNFLAMGPPGSDTCRRSLDVLIRECHALGVCLVAEKIEGPSPVLTFLGIEIDTQADTLSLPQESCSFC